LTRFVTHSVRLLAERQIAGHDGRAAARDAFSVHTDMRCAGMRTGQFGTTLSGYLTQTIENCAAAIATTVIPGPPDCIGDNPEVKDCSIEPGSTASIRTVLGDRRRSTKPGANMNTGTIIAIGFFSFAIVLILIALAWVWRNKRKEHRHPEVGKIRDRTREETLQVRQREALAEQTAAQAHAAQTEAQVKAAEASRLQQHAAAHRDGVASDRDRLEKQRERADQVDPATQTPEAARSAERK
jgi:hypothetical protein